MVFAVLAGVSASIADLKCNPMRVIREGAGEAGEAVVVLHQNKPAFYAVHPGTVRVDVNVLIAQAEIPNLEK